VVLAGLLGLKCGYASRRLYYTKIEIGTPPKQYHVQVDTGSDILWVNCISCDKCPRKSGLGVALPPCPRPFFVKKIMEFWVCAADTIMF
jgi:hypothetical protein